MRFKDADIKSLLYDNHSDLLRLLAPLQEQVGRLERTGLIHCSPRLARHRTKAAWRKILSKARSMLETFTSAFGQHIELCEHGPFAVIGKSFRRSPMIELFSREHLNISSALEDASHSLAHADPSAEKTLLRVARAAELLISLVLDHVSNEEEFFFWFDIAKISNEERLSLLPLRNASALDEF